MSMAARSSQLAARLHRACRMATCQAGTGNKDATKPIYDEGCQEHTAPSYEIRRRTLAVEPNLQTISAPEEASNTRNLEPPMTTEGKTNDNMLPASSTRQTDEDDLRSQREIAGNTNIEKEEEPCVARAGKPDDYRSRTRSSLRATSHLAPCVPSTSPPASPCPRTSTVGITHRPATTINGADYVDNNSVSSDSSSGSSISSGDCSSDSDDAAGVNEDFTYGADSWLEDVHGVGRVEFFDLFKRDKTPQFSRPALALLGRNVSRCLALRRLRVIGIVRSGIR